MGCEIERKFLVDLTRWQPPTSGGIAMQQAYLGNGNQLTLRVRLATVLTNSLAGPSLAGEAAYLTIKGKSRDGVSRSEFEYPIPVADAHALIAEFATVPAIVKTRYRIPFAGHVWEVDVFAGANAGLVTAEVELQSVEEPFDRPEWLGMEVSQDRRYRNAALAVLPYSQWQTQASGNQVEQQ